MKTYNRSALPKRIAAMLLMLAMIFTYIPITAMAATDTVDITGKSVAEMKTAIEAALAEFDTVTVTGDGGEVTAQLTLHLPEGKRVVWKAQITGAVHNLVTTVAVNNVYSHGTFEVAEDGVINATGTTGYAIYAESTSIIVSGGIVIGTQGIYCTNATVTSGSVSATGSGDMSWAINALTRANIEGGIVRAGNGVAINSYGGTVTVSGGVVFAYGKAIVGESNVIYTRNAANYTGPTGDGVVIAWNQSAGNDTYLPGSTLDIVKSPSMATAAWSAEGDGGIAYEKGSNNGLIPIAAVVVETGDATVNGLRYKILTPPDGQTGGTVEVSGNSDYSESTLVIPDAITVSDADDKNGSYDVVGISRNAFESNKKITSLTIGENVQVIGEGSFRGCSNLSGSLIIPNSVTSIEENAFRGCLGFTGSLTIGSSVTSIGSDAFYGCSGFTGSLTIPDSVTSIGSDAFSGCSGFTGSLTIGSSVTSISPNAFYECSGFTGSLTIPDSVISIGSYAFKGCSGFTGSLTIPDSVTSIDQMAFIGCSGLTAIDSSLKSLADVMYNSFSGITEKPLTCAPELVYIHQNYGFTSVSSKAFTPAITVDGGSSDVYGSFTVSIDLGCAPESGLTSDILTVTNGTAGTLTYTPYSNSDTNLSTPADNAIATCVITPSADGAVTVTVDQGKYYFANTANSASDTLSVTADLAATAVSSIVPANGAVDVPVDTTIAITFNREMDTTKGSLTGISGSGQWSEDGETYTFTPFSALSPGTEYNFTLVGFSGFYYALAGTTSFSFTTGKLTLTIGDLNYTDPTTLNHVYNGSPQGIGAVTGPSGAGTITVLYNGSATLPTSAGTYAVTVENSGGAEYSATMLALGDYTIASKSVIVAAGTYNVSKAYDGTTNAGTGSGDLEITGILAADSGVSVTATPGAFSGAGVGNGHTVTVALALSGDTDGNYSLANTTVSVPGAITAKTITITPDGSQTKIFGAADPALTFSNDGGLSDSIFSGALSRASGENVGTYAINIGTLSAGDNYTLSLNSTPVNFTITQATVTSIDTTVNDVTMNAYDARSATNSADVVALANLPATVTVTTDGGTTTLPITWATTNSFDAKGATYSVTGTLTGNTNIANGGVTKTVTVTVSPTTTTNPTFADTLVVKDSHSGSATAAALQGDGTLPTSGSITVQGVDVSYTVSWSGTALDTTAVDNNETFTGTISYSSPPAWLTLPTGTVSRKVTVTDKQQVTISTSSITDKEYSGAAYVPGAVSSGAVDSATLVWKWESTDGGNYDSATPPTDAGDYKVTISVPDGNTGYFGSAEYTFSITKAALTITAENKTVQQGASLPAVTIDYSGFKGSDNENNAFSTAPVAAHSVSDTNTTGTYSIDFTTLAVLNKDNYTVTHQGGELSVTLVLSSDATLSALSISTGGLTPAFNSATTSYTASVANNISSVTIAATKNHSGATVSGDIGAKSLNVGTNSFTITVVAEDGVAAKTYTITVTRQSSGGGDSPGGGAPSTSSNTDTTITAPTSEKGWTDAAEKVNDLKDGAEVTIDMKNTTTVSGEFLKAVAGKDVDITFDMGGGVTWTVNGTDIPKDADLSSINLSVSTGIGFVPAEVRNIDGSISEVQLRLAHNGEFGFTMTLSVKLDKVNAGSYANLYYYNEATGALEFQSAVKIGTDGAAEFEFSHASDYLIVVAETNLAPVVWQNPFTDVSASSWFYAAVQYAHENGIMQGTSNTTFDPNTNLSRAMMVQILWNLEGKPAAASATFTDVASGAWYEDAVAWAASKGIVNGYGNDLFGPNDSITREQMAVILHNYCTYKGITLPSARTGDFTDSGSISTWAAEAVKSMYEAAILSGKGNNTFDPKGTATRAEIAQMMMNFMEATK